MAYEKQTWINGDVITQEKLNHIEDGIEDAYELPSVTETDNGKVLGVENGAWSVVNGGGDAGYECTETVIFNETVTTATSSQMPIPSARLAYTGTLDAEVLNIVFDGVEYTCHKKSSNGMVVYGGDTPGDFSEYPFMVAKMASGNTLYTQTAGEHSIEASSSSVSEISECFKLAVQSSEKQEVINLVYGEEYSFDEFISILKSTMPITMTRVTTGYGGSVTKEMFYDISCTLVPPQGTSNGQATIIGKNSVSTLSLSTTDLRNQTAPTWTVLTE